MHGGKGGYLDFQSVYFAYNPSTALWRKHEENIQHLTQHLEKIFVWESIQVHYSHFRASKEFDSLFFDVIFVSIFVEIQRHNKLNFFGCIRNFAVYKVLMMSLLFSMNSMRSWSSSVPSIVKTWSAPWKADSVGLLLVSLVLEGSPGWSLMCVAKRSAESKPM